MIFMRIIQIQAYLVVDPNVPGDVQFAVFKLNKCVEDIQLWMVENKLMLSQDKTEFFIASSLHHRKKLDTASLLLVDVEIFPSESVQNLGIVFDLQMCVFDHAHYSVMYVCQLS